MLLNSLSKGTEPQIFKKKKKKKKKEKREEKKKGKERKKRKKNYKAGSGTRTCILNIHV